MEGKPSSLPSFGSLEMPCCPRFRPRLTPLQKKLPPSSLTMGKNALLHLPASVRLRPLTEILRARKWRQGFSDACATRIIIFHKLTACTIALACARLVSPAMMRPELSSVSAPLSRLRRIRDQALILTQHPLLAVPDTMVS